MEIRVACFSFSLSAHEPMAYVRLIAPFRHLGVQIVDGLQYGADLSNLIEQCDVVFLQREFPVRFDIYRRITEIAWVERKPVVLELDDLLFFLPEKHPDRQKHYYAPALLPMLQALIEADAITVPTVRMRNFLVDYNENIFVIPNYLDDAVWSLRFPSFLNVSPPYVTIGYMGTKSHKPDLEYVAPVLSNLVQRYPHQLRLRFWGIQPPTELLQFPQVEWIPCDYRSYEDFARFFQTQAADIFIAPLVDNVFNRCKSPLKFFEYTALGAPGVFSRIEPYESVVRHGENGLLAYSLDEWEESLVRLIENNELRYYLATNAQKTVREHWLLSRNAFHWQSVLQKILVFGKKQVVDSPFLELIRSINIQLSDAIHALNDQVEAQGRTIQSLNDQVEAQRKTIQLLNDQIEAMKQEILSYALSRSWRWTRPFRIFHRKLLSVRRGLCGGN